MADIVLLDGGMGQELIRRSGKPATPLWSTQALLDAPGLVAEVHGAFADAGATVATTNSYALHRDRLRGGDSNHYAGAGLALADLEDRFETLLAAACDAADGVRDRQAVAGSIGPLGASYRPDLLPPHDTAVALFAEMASLLAPRVDLLLFETVPSVAAARACLEAGRTVDLPVWIALTVDDSDGTRLRSGEPVAEAARALADADAVLVNCSVPEVIAPALEALAPLGRPFGAYANAFTGIDPAFAAGGATVSVLSARRDMGPAEYAEQAMGWVAQGATIVGGCCEVGPDHIAALAERLRAEGHRIVRPGG